MKQFSAEDIQALDRIYRLNLINSVSGFKSANLIGTRNKTSENLAIISSVIHLGSDPALLGFIMRPGGTERDTLSNIIESSYYSINAISSNIIEKAHYTSAKFPKGVSEFEQCKLVPEYLDDFYAPFLKESNLKIGMKLQEIIPIPINNTSLIIGSIESLNIAEQAIADNGQVDLNYLDTVAISGLNRYHKANEIAKFPYARVNELPTFNKYWPYSTLSIGNVC